MYLFQFRSKFCQQGSAIITALLIVLFTAALVVSLVWRQHISIKRSEQMIDSIRAYQYAIGVEDWALGYLKNNLPPPSSTNNPNTTTATTPTSTSQTNRTKPIPFPVQFSEAQIPGGTLSGSIEDMQSKFNINFLYSSSGLQSFEALVKTVDSNYKEASLNELVSNISSALQTSQTGQNTTYYNYKMASISELLLIPNFPVKLYLELIPYITALPRNTTINVNTMNPALLSLFVPNVTSSLIESFVSRQQNEGFQSTSDFSEFISSNNPSASNSSTTSQGQQNSTDSTQVNSTNSIPVSTTSTYYLSTANVKIGYAHLVLYTVIQISVDTTGKLISSVVWRSRGSL